MKKETEEEKKIRSMSSSEYGTMPRILSAAVNGPGLDTVRKHNEYYCTQWAVHKECAPAEVPPPFPRQNGEAELT